MRLRRRVGGVARISRREGSIHAAAAERIVRQEHSLAIVSNLPGSFSVHASQTSGTPAVRGRTFSTSANTNSSILKNVLVHTPHETPGVTVAEFVHVRPSSVGGAETALEVGRQTRGRPRANTALDLERLRQASPGIDNLGGAWSSSSSATIRSSKETGGAPPPGLYV